jgi:hypothetical protein
MFPLYHVCVSSISRSKRISAERVLGLLLTLFLLPAALHATPIGGHDSIQLQSAKHRPAFLTLSSKGKSVLHLAAVNSVQPLSSATPSRSPSSGCLFAGDCANPIHIPEPQALALFGTGILSFAAFMRHRLTR